MYPELRLRVRTLCFATVNLWINHCPLSRVVVTPGLIVRVIDADIDPPVGMPPTFWGYVLGVAFDKVVSGISWDSRLCKANKNSRRGVSLAELVNHLRENVGT
jgi:hypothetical protein